MEGQDPGWSQDKDQLAELVGHASQEAPGLSQHKDQLAEQLVGQASQDPGWSQDKDPLAVLVGQASQDPGWSQDKDQLIELVGQASQEASGLSQDKDQLTELVGQASQKLLMEQLIDPYDKEKEEMAMAMTGQEADKPGGQLEPEQERAVKRKAAEEDEWDALLASQEESPENMDMDQSPVNEETRGGEKREEARAPSWLDIQVWA